MINVLLHILLLATCTFTNEQNELKAKNGKLSGLWGEAEPHKSAEAFGWAVVSIVLPHIIPQISEKYQEHEYASNPLQPSPVLK